MDDDIIVEPLPQHTDPTFYPPNRDHNVHAPLFDAIQKRLDNGDYYEQGPLKVVARVSVPYPLCRYYHSSHLQALDELRFLAKDYLIRDFHAYTDSRVSQNNRWLWMSANAVCTAFILIFLYTLPSPFNIFLGLGMAGLAVTSILIMALSWCVLPVHVVDMYLAI
jgi:hypothetical protein